MAVSGVLMPACLLPEKYDAPTAYCTFSSASCSVSPAIDRDGSLFYLVVPCLPGQYLPRRPGVNEFSKDPFALNSK